MTLYGRPPAWHFRQGQKVVSQHDAQPVVPVPIVRVVPVAVRTAHVPLIIVERAAPQHAVATGPSPQHKSL